MLFLLTLSSSIFHFKLLFPAAKSEPVSYPPFSHPLFLFIFFYKKIISTSRCCSTFFHQYDLNSFQSFRKTFRSGLFSVLCPAKPALRLRMHPVIYIILICQRIFQFNLYCFKSLSFSLCSAVFSAINPLLPSVGLYMRSI